MNVKDWQKAAIQQLNAADIPTSRLDALVLLEDTSGKDRAWLLAHHEFELDKKTIDTLKAQLKRRLTHEPLAYIRGKSEFYGRSFNVTPATLQPRSETETMIDLLKGLGLSKKHPVLADIGTGSGCIAITAKLEFPNATVFATEINADALKIAIENARRLQAEVTFCKGNLLDPLSSNPEVLLCNLPYVPDSHTINQAAMQEPKIAIFGGKDGLDLYRELFKQIKDGSRPQYILTESLPFQHESLAAIAQKYDYTQITREDFIQVFSSK